MLNFHLKNLLKENLIQELGLEISGESTMFYAFKQEAFQ